jgi:hypothetical protein
VTTSSSRRTFLKQSSSATLGLAVVGNPSVIVHHPTQKKLRVGIVGGRFGCSFQFHEHPDCIVEAVSDLRPERRE